MSYQDKWVKGEVAGEGQRECASRYAVLRRVLRRYQRPFTMFDLGASEGYFSFRAAYEFDCVAVMAEGGSQLLPMCERNAPAVLLEHRFSSADLDLLAQCEHFDVVLALNVLHHFPDWRPALDAVLRLGDWVVLETPPPDDDGACGQGAIPGIYDAVKDMGEQIASTPSHVSDVERPMFLIRGNPRGITRPYVDSPDVVNNAFRPLTVKSSDTEKTVAKDGTVRDWVPGINLRTYQRFGGAWPKPETIARWVESTPLPNTTHGDVRPWNFILSGDGVRLIDGGDEKAIYDDAEGLALTAAELRS